METFVKARARILMELMRSGWVVKSDLKIPHATSPDGNIRLWFKPQAVYGTASYGQFSSHQFSDARSLWADIRGAKASELASYASTFLAR